MPPNNGIERLVRPDLASFVGYSPCKSPDTLAGKVEVPVESIIKLDANENPYGCSPRVNRALAAYPYVNIYPDAAQTELRKQLQKYTSVGAEHIVAGSGSDELIDLILRLFLEPGDEVISCTPTFDMYRFSTKLCGGTMVEIPRDENFAIRVDAVKAAITKRTKVIFVANPNNPTGTLTPRRDILQILDTGLPVVVDEAYYEFSGQTVAPLVTGYANLMVLRTFSKWAGLAGLRVGYGIFPCKIAETLLTIKPPYNVNVAALVAVSESLRDAKYLVGSVQKIITERDRMFNELKQLAWLKPFPSYTNFIFCSVLNGDARELQLKLQSKGIIVRYFGLPFWRNGVRITVGKPEHTDALLKALREASGK
ncbi:MAG: histidinol-phosphate transaminase [Chloroflexota bacterium]|nr:histidinol-phosphate transaminase [Chloroflexota bacterium]